MGLRFALDVSATAKPQRTGVARYATCLVDALLEAAPDDQFTLAYRLSRIRRHRYLYRPQTANSRIRFFTDKVLRVALGRVDLFHGLDARIPELGSFPRVATLHDVAPAVRAEIASEKFRDKKRRAYQLLADRADRIICVSAATRDSFRELHDLPEERFRVIHHGLEPRFRPAPPERVAAVLDELRIQPPYLLFVGLLSARKNCVPLVRAFDRVARKVGNLRLVLAGGHGHGFTELAETIRRTQNQKRILLPGFVRDDHLPALYSGTAGFVFPSKNEGFGIPILEAMACGAPVVAADTPVAREVAGDRALLVDTADEDVLADTLLNLHPPSQEVQSMVDRGREHALTFTWRRAAEETLEVYRELISSRKVMT